MLVALLILAQFALIGYTIFSNSMVSDIVMNTANLVSLLVVLHVVISKNKPAYKISLTFLIFMFPLFGGIFYLLYKSNAVWRGLHKRTEQINKASAEFFRLPETAVDEAKAKMPEFSTQISYADGYMGFPVYKNTQMSYYRLGEEMFAALCEDLKKAERYIFLEFFIVKEGKMWSAVEEILTERAAAGVDVRLIYDDMGSLYGFSDDRIDGLGKKGIKISVFNTFVPFISSVQNNRDHRKIAVIDGKTAYTGGINLADEYINEIERFGHWKDTAIRLCGDGAWGFTVMFLQMGSLCEDIDEDYRRYYPDNVKKVENGGFVLPYTDSPIDNERLGEHIYKQMIDGSREYLYITTPYLIVDDDLISALRLAAKSGVDVRIITPGHGDKFLVHFTTRSYYELLMEAGVRIYEYTPGFIHSKTFVSDGRRAVVGTVNLDFRSLYLHFECGALVYDDAVTEDVKNDFLDTLEVCHEITAEDCKCSLLVRFFRSVMRIFAPLM